MRVDYAMIPELHAAARRHRAEMIGSLFAAAFAWLLSRELISRKPAVSHASRPHFAR